MTDDLVGRARELLQSARLNLPIIEIERKHGGEYDTSFSAPADLQPQESDPVVLFKTGGYSGPARFVPVNHKQLLHASLYLKNASGIQPADRVFTQLSWAHPFPFVHGLLFPLLAGSTVVIEHGLEGVELLK